MAAEHENMSNSGGHDTSGTKQIETWRESLQAHRTEVDSDPRANPIELLALEMLSAMSDGELDMKRLDGLVQHLTMEAFVERAQRLEAYLGEVDPEANKTAIAEILRNASPDAMMAVSFRSSSSGDGWSERISAWS